MKTLQQAKKLGLNIGIPVQFIPTDKFFANEGTSKIKTYHLIEVWFLFLMRKEK